MQLVGYIHGQNIDRCFGLGGLVQLGHNQVQAISAFEITVPSFNGVAGTGILAYLSGLLGTGIPLSRAVPEPDQSDGYHFLRNTADNADWSSPSSLSP